MKREERYKLTKEKNESGMVSEKIIDTRKQKGLLSGNPVYKDRKSTRLNSSH